MLTVRWMSRCEYAALMVHGVINAATAPFAVVAEEDDQADCLPPTVPVGSLMLWPSDDVHSPVFGSRFGSVGILFDMPEDVIVWRGRGRYVRRDDWGETPRYWTEIWEEIAVSELRSEWIVSVDDLWADEPLRGCEQSDYWGEDACEICRQAADLIAAG